MLLVIPITVVFALSYSAYILLGLNTIESIFLSISAIIIAMLTLSLFAGLQISAYIVCAIIVIVLGIATFKSIKSKRLLKDIIAFINNPAFAAFVVAVGIYAYFIHDNHLYTWDDFSHWGLAVRALVAFDGIDITPGILEPQTIGMPMWNAFLVSLSGMSEGYMLIGMWMLYWACLLLPVSRVKWDRSATVIVYTILMYALLMFISHQPRPNLYCDAMLSVVSGSLIAYYYLNKEKSDNYFYVLILGCALLPHIKNATGVAFAALVVSFPALDMFSDKGNLSKPNKRRLIYTVAAATVSGAYVYALKKIMRTGEFRDGRMWCNPMADITKALLNPIGIALVILMTASVAIFAVLRVKKNGHTLKAAVAFCAISAGLILWTAYNLEGNTRLLITQFAKNLWRLDIYGLRANLILLTMAAGGVLIYYFGINDKSKKAFSRIGLVFTVQMIIYLISVMLSYSKFTYGEGIKSADLYRYLLSFLAYAAIGGVGIIICEQDIFKSKWIRLSALGLVSAIILIFAMPKPLTLYNYEKDLKYTSTYNYKAELLGRDISSALGTQARVYVVTQGDSGHLANLIRNFSLPVYTSRESYSLGPPKSDVDGWSVELTPAQLSEYIIDREYTHLFILEIDDYFIQEYGHMFDDPSNIYTWKLYKIVETGDGDVRFMLLSDT